MAGIEKVTPERAQRARERQLDYMRSIAREWEGYEAEIVDGMVAKSRRVRDLLSAVKPVQSTDRALEVGSGGTGIIFNFGTDEGVGVDPLADDLRQLFPWQRKSSVPTVTAGGEDLPFADGEFDIVFSDNVIDHAADPQKILAEIARVLKRGGLFYFTVHVHHPIYHYSSLAYGLWRRLGLPGEVTPFADHTVHLTVDAANRLFDGLPFRIVTSGTDIEDAKQEARAAKPRHLGDRLKRLFFKNATFEAIAVRE